MEEGTPKQNTFPFFPRSSPHTTHIAYFQESTLILQKGISNNMISLCQKCDTFDRTTKGRTRLAGVTSQDHPDYTQFIWSSSIKIHFLVSQ